MRVMAAAVLGLESVVLFLTTPVMVRVTDVSTPVALGVGIGLGAAALLLSALLRYRWAYVAGLVLQVAAVGLGFAVPAMFLLGPIFAGCWIAALVLGRRIERLKAERDAETPPR